MGGSETSSYESGFAGLRIGGGDVVREAWGKGEDGGAQHAIGWGHDLGRREKSRGTCTWSSSRLFRARIGCVSLWRVPKVPWVAVCRAEAREVLEKSLLEATQKNI